MTAQLKEDILRKKGQGGLGGQDTCHCEEGMKNHSQKARNSKRVYGD